jgi:hypothetical protein
MHCEGGGAEAVIGSLTGLCEACLGCGVSCPLLPSEPPAVLQFFLQSSSGPHVRSNLIGSGPSQLSAYTRQLITPPSGLFRSFNLGPVSGS